MKKKKAQYVQKEEQEEEQVLKPWMLQNISPEVRRIAKESAIKHNVKVSQWVTHSIITTYQNEKEQTVHIDTFAELIEDLPSREFMRNSFIGLREKIEDLTQKIENGGKVIPNQKPWWKFWA